MALAHLLLANRLVIKNDPAIGVGHYFGFLIQLLLLAGKYFRHWQVAGLSLLLQHLLLVLKTEQLGAILQQRIQESVVHISVNELDQLLGHKNTLIGVTFVF